MVTEDKIFNQKLLAYLQIIASEGISNAAKGFSGMLGQKMTVTEPVVRMIHLSEIPNILGGPENEAVGTYLRAEGSVGSQIMLITPYQKALDLVDLLLEQPQGTTQQLGTLERSALAEVGNITGTFFMNSVAALTGMDLRPTPPAVMVDMVGAILDIIIATMGGISEHVLLLEANFMIGDRSVGVDFWVIPDPKTLEAFSTRL